MHGENPARVLVNATRNTSCSLGTKNGESDLRCALELTGLLVGIFIETRTPRSAIAPSRSPTLRGRCIHEHLSLPIEHYQVQVRDRLSPTSPAASPETRLYRRPLTPLARGWTWSSVMPVELVPSGPGRDTV
jgi:hypothetical protein